MSDSKDGGRLASLGNSITPETYQKMQESLWKSYGSKKNWEDAKSMAKQLAHAERQIAELREQVALQDKEIQAFVLEWARLTKDDVQ
jgi:hypothetical protein